MATKKQAAEALGVSMAEVLRMIKRGDLKAHRKTASRFSDWIIDLSSMKKAGSVEAEVTATLAKVVPAPPATTDEPESPEEEAAEASQPDEENKDGEADVAVLANPKDAEVGARIAPRSTTDVDASGERKTLAETDESEGTPASHPVKNANRGDVNPAVRSETDGTRALERRRLFLLKRRQQRETEEKNRKESTSDGKGTDSRREQSPAGDGKRSEGSDQADPKKGKEPKWWF